MLDSVLCLFGIFICLLFCRMAFHWTISYIHGTLIFSKQAMITDLVFTSQMYDFCERQHNILPQYSLGLVQNCDTYFGSDRIFELGLAQNCDTYFGSEVVHVFMLQSKSQVVASTYQAKSFCGSFDITSSTYAPVQRQKVNPL